MTSWLTAEPQSNRVAGAGQSTVAGKTHATCGLICWRYSVAMNLKPVNGMSKKSGLASLIGLSILVSGCSSPAWQRHDVPFSELVGAEEVEGCEVGRTEDCLTLIDALEEKPELTEPESVALFELYNAACSFGSDEACFRVGELYFYGDRANPDPESAHATLTQACDAGQSDACYFAGFVLLEGKVGPEDEPGAVPYLRAGCALDHPQCCSQIGLMYHFARGLPADPVSARSHFERACELGEAYVGCFNFALYLADEPDSELDVLWIQELMGASCESGNAVACENLSVIDSWGP